MFSERKGLTRQYTHRSLKIRNFLTQNLQQFIHHFKSIYTLNFTGIRLKHLHIFKKIMLYWIVNNTEKSCRHSFNLLITSFILDISNLVLKFEQIEK